MTVPMGIYNLDDNMIIQVGAFALTFVCWGIWLVACFFSDNLSTLPAVNTGPYGSQAGVIGTILFNFGFVTTVPSWVNEKRPGVSVNKSVWYATFICIVVFFVMGIPPAMAFKDILGGVAMGECSSGGKHHDNCASSLMDVFTTDSWMPHKLLEHAGAKNLVRASVYLFPIVAVLSSIPVFSIVVKYNCLENGFSRRFSFLWGVVFPWVVALPLLYQPDALNQFITFSSLIFVSFTDFVIPCCLYFVLNRSDKHHEDARFQERHPLTGNARINDDAEVIKREDEEAAVPPTRHYALPPRWGFSYTAREAIAIILVVVMAVSSIAGTVLQIQTSASTEWNCAAAGT
eukprot:m.131288 g.131288  ORF g.131288 m.131288 type:complete len:345 (+) comp9808_c0_seq1:645-1679(+)